MLLPGVVFAIVSFASIVAATSTALPPFNKIQLCAPFNIAVFSGNATDYSISISANSSDVESAINASVNDNKLLSIVTTKSLSTQQPIKVAITVPSRQLQAVQVLAAQAVVYVAGHAAASTFTASQQGSGGIVMIDFNVTDLIVSLIGSAKVFVNGSIGDASVKIIGSGNVGLNGVEGTVQASVIGNGNVYILPYAGGMLRVVCT